MKKSSYNPTPLLSRPHFREAIVLPLLTALLFAITPAGVADSGRRGSDPLSESEMNFVRNAVPAPEPVAARPAGSAGATAASGDGSGAASPGGIDPVLLLIERRLPDKKGLAPQRLADVYWYDYSDNALLHSIVDVQTGRVRSKETLYETQLPLVETEVQRAAAIVMSHPETRERLNRAFEAITGRELNDIDDINFKAFVFHTDTLPAELVRESAMCGLHRCAQMVTYTHDNITLDVSPIIDLSAGRVTQSSAP